MNTVIEFFKNKWVIYSIGFMALGLLIWFIGPLISIADYAPLESELSRITMILICFLLLLLNYFYQQLKSRKANAQMLADLSAQNSSSAIDTRSEVVALQKTFDEALQLLKKGAKTKQGSQYIYDLPWYILIGPPGSGKTTALIHSGLHFPLEKAFGKHEIRGIGGTRNCDWLFTNEAVLIDTAGRYVTQDSHQDVDKAAWHGFLDLLNKYRPRRPINGALITMSLSDLMKQTPEERSQHAQVIRQRIEELSEYFGIRFPIYMLFTKADLIAGFNDFFINLTAEERKQVWGVTFQDNNAKVKTHLMQFSQDYDDLLTRLYERLPTRLQEERNLERRSLIFGFPQRMALLKEHLINFVQECYGENRYQSEPYLRGIYITSGTQEGTPIDRLMGTLANTFKLDRLSMPLFSGKGRSYFITQLLKDVIFEESEIAGLNQKREQLQLVWRNSIYIGLASLIALMSGLWLTSYYKNQAILETVGNQLKTSRTVIAETPDWETNFAQLLKRLDTVQTMSTVLPKTTLLDHFGLYQADKIAPLLQQIYIDILQKQFLPLIKQRLEQRIQQQLNNTEILYPLLECYLMLAELEKLKPELVKDSVNLDWEKLFATDPEAQTHLAQHLNQLLATKLEPIEVNERLVAASRQILNRVPLPQQLYMRIKSESLQHRSQDFKLLTAIGGNAERVFVGKNGSLSQLTVPYLFTYDGFYQKFLKEAKRLSGESIQGSWVLGDAAKITTVDNEKLAEDIRQLYYQDYIKYWDELLVSIKIKPISSPQQSQEILEFASSKTDSPLKKLLEALTKQTELTKKPSNITDVSGQAQQAAGLNPLDNRTEKLLAMAKAEGLTGNTMQPLGSQVENHFLPLINLVKNTNGSAPLDHTLDVLGQLYGYMLDINSGQATLDKAKSGGEVLAKIKMESAYLPEPLKSMTQALSSGNQNLIMGGSKSQLNQLWQSEIVPFYQKGISGRYPFAKSSVKEATLSDFSQLFAPGALLDTFFNANLKPFVDTSGKIWKMLPQNGQAVPISPATLAQFQHVQQFRQLFFPAGAQNPLVRFSLKPMSVDANVSKFSLIIDGQLVSYDAQTNTARAIPLQWPGNDGSHFVRFEFETRDGQKLNKEIEGDWALFRTLQLLNINRIDESHYIVIFTVNNLTATYELSANSVNNPFSLIEFGNIQLPLSL